MPAPWTSVELGALRSAVAQVSSKTEKQERWRQISELVGSRGKRECYDTYKSLKEAKLAKRGSAAESKVTGSTPGGSGLQKNLGNELDDLLCEIGGGVADSKKIGNVGHALDGGKSDRNSGAKNLDGGQAAAEAKMAPFEQGVRLGRGALRSEQLPVAEAKEAEGFDDESALEPSPQQPATKDAKDAQGPEALNHGCDDVARVLQRAEITIAQSNELRELIFGDRKRILPDAWKKQGFYFSPSKHPGIGYGLVQSKGGPCGVLAPLNALVIAELLYPEDHPRIGAWADPPAAELKKCLVLAIARMLHQAAGGSGQCVVCLPSRQPVLARSSAYSPDGVTEFVQLWTVAAASPRALVPFLKDNIEPWLDPQGPGAVLLLFSVIFTRTVQGVKRDMDEGFAGERRTLMDRHAYMSQEGVNLLLVGRASSNVFDGSRRLDDQDQGSAVSHAAVVLYSRPFFSPYSCNPLGCGRAEWNPLPRTGGIFDLVRILRLCRGWQQLQSSRASHLDHLQREPLQCPLRAEPSPSRISKSRKRLI